jgi:hypothetical protein
LLGRFVGSFNGGDSMTAEDKEKALTNPSSVFKRPLDVLDCSDLSRDEKEAILKQWELDARLLQVATEEGMTGGERPLFGEVKAAQKALHVGHLEADGPPSKVGP